MLYYSFEYALHAPTFDRVNISVLTSRADLLYTLSSQCPSSRWEKDGAALQRAAASFSLLRDARGVGAQFPDRL